MEELKEILERFEESGWALIAVPARQWLEGAADRPSLTAAIREASRECGSCGCALDPLYQRALELLENNSLAKGL